MTRLFNGPVLDILLTGDVSIEAITMEGPVNEHAIHKCDRTSLVHGQFTSGKYNLESSRWSTPWIMSMYVYLNI